MRAVPINDKFMKYKKSNSKVGFSPVILVFGVVIIALVGYVLLTSINMSGVDKMNSALNQDSDYSDIQKSSNSDEKMNNQQGTEIVDIEKEINSAILEDVEVELKNLGSEASSL